MALMYDITAGTYPVPPTYMGYYRNDTLVVDKVSMLFAILKNTSFSAVKRYNRVWQNDTSSYYYYYNIYGNYYFEKATNTYELFSGLPVDPRTSSFLPVPNTAYGLARWTTKAYEDGGFLAEGLEDIRPPKLVDAGVLAITFPDVNVAMVHYTGGSLIDGDTNSVGDTNSIAAQSGETSSTIRRTLNFPVPEGQYEVRLRRVSPDTDSNRIADSVVWTALRSFQVGEAISEQNMARTALRIRATDQLNGSIDNYNCIAQTVCLDFDVISGEWVERATSNPAALYRFVLQGPANKRPLTDSQIDFDSLEEWHTMCEDEHFEFNHYVDYRSSVDSILQMIASAGRAAPGYIDGKYGVVMDKVQENIAQHFTPRNSWDYSYNKVFFDRPHAFRVKFWNAEEDWREDERIVYDDGYSEANATKFEELSLPGVTSAFEAYKHGRYHIATARLRPETHTFNTDFEYLTCTRGDRIKFTSDIISVGLGYGRIKSYTDDGINVSSISIDESLPMEDGKSYQFRIRQHDGTSIAITLITVVGYHTIFGVLGTLPIASAPNVNALFMYGETAEESIDLIVKTITPTSDLTATLTCLSYAPEVHTAHEGIIPAFDSHITLPVDRVSVYKPLLTLRSDESAIVVDRAAGTVSLRIIATADTQQIPPGMVDKMLVRYRRSGTVNPWTVVETTGSEAFLVDDIVRGVSYEIQACYFIDFRQGLWTDAVHHVVIGMSNPPDDITNFRSSVTAAESIILTWDALTVLDFSHYIIRYASDIEDATWEKSIELARTTGTTKTIPNAKDGTYLIKAFDLENRESVNASLVITSLPSLQHYNAIELINENGAWVGVKDRCYSYHEKLSLDMAGKWDDITDFDAWENISSCGGAEPDGYYYPAEIVNLLNVQTSKCSLEFDFYVVDTDDLTESPSDYIPPGVGILSQISTSDDNIVWTAWEPFVNGYYVAKYLKFRLHLFSADPQYFVVVNQFEVFVDMPDRAYSGQDIDIAAGGTAISFDTPYMIPPIVRATIESAVSGDTLKVTAVTTTGFTLQILNESGTGVARVVDWQSVGY